MRAPSHSCQLFTFYSMLARTMTCDAHLKSQNRPSQRRNGYTYDTEVRGTFMSASAIQHEYPPVRHRSIGRGYSPCPRCFPRYGHFSLRMLHKPTACLSEILHMLAIAFFRSPPETVDTGRLILDDLVKHRDLDALIQGFSATLDQRNQDNPSFVPLDLTYRSDTTSTSGVTSSVGLAVDRDPWQGTDYATTPENQSLNAPEPDDDFGNVPDVTCLVERNGLKPLAFGGFSQIFPGTYLDPITGAKVQVVLRWPMLKHAKATLRRVCSCIHLIPCYLHNGACQRFLREAELWFGLKHPNINELIGIYQDKDDLYAVSPFCRQGSVRLQYARGCQLHHLNVVRYCLLASWLCNTDESSFKELPVHCSTCTRSIAFTVILKG